MCGSLTGTSRRQRSYPLCFHFKTWVHMCLCAYVHNRKPHTKHIQTPEITSPNLLHSETSGFLRCFFGVLRTPKASLTAAGDQAAEGAAWKDPFDTVGTRSKDGPDCPCGLSLRGILIGQGAKLSCGGGLDSFPGQVYIDCDHTHSLSPLPILWATGSSLCELAKIHF